jgi:hypothetical protein
LPYRPLTPDDRVLRDHGRSQVIRAYHKFACHPPGQPLPEPEGLVETAVLRNLQLWADTGNSLLMSVLWDRVLGKPEQWLLVGGPEGSVQGLQISMDVRPAGAINLAVAAEIDVTPG